MGLAKLCKNYCINRSTGDDGLCDVCRGDMVVLGRQADARIASANRITAGVKAQREQVRSGRPKRG